uniref:Type 1 glutamine amidotransferase n=1 Tax=Desulfobacca acetoxidans TaxID=60893 RepID=A0A7C3Z3A0_9BACT
MAVKKILLVQHLDWEGPGGHLRAALAEADIPFEVAEVWHRPLPPLEPYASLIVLGGSPNVDEEKEFPYLKPLKALIKEVIASGRAYLGFCLGHQLLAHVLGCRVGPLPRKSIGFITGHLTPRGQAHPVFQGLPAEFRLFKWHGQGVHLPVPQGLEILASSPAAPVEALGIMGNPRVVGLQFDNHADAKDVAKWLAHDREWALAGSGVDPDVLLSQASGEEAAMGEEFRRFMGNFFRVAGLI